MPVPNCSTTTSQTGADSTLPIKSANQLSSQTKFDSTSWFSDLDINAVLDSYTHKPKYNFINPIFVQMLIKGSILNFDLSSSHKDAEKIFVPILILDCHWILFVYDNTTNKGIWMDPVKKCYKEAESVKSCKAVHLSLNRIFNRNHQFLPKPITNIRFQDNGYDCGPLTCFYAIQMMNNGKLNDEQFNLLNIRKFAFESNTSINPSDTKKNLFGGASNSSQNSPTEIIDVLQMFYRDCHQIHILNSESVLHIRNNDRNSIMDSIKFKTFRQVNYIATCFSLNEDTYLYIYQFIEMSSSVFNLTGNLLSESSLVIAELLTNYLNIFCLNGKASLQNQLPNSEQCPVNTQLAEKSIMICSQYFSQHTTNIPEVNSSEINGLVNRSQRISRDSTRLINSRMNHESIVSYFKILNLDDSFVIIDTILSTALLDENWSYLTSFFDVSQIKQAKTVFVLVQPPNFHTCLLIIGLQCWEYYILNPSTTIIEENLRVYCSAIVGKLSEFTCFGMENFSINSIPYLTNGSGLFSNLLICGYLENFSNDLPLSDIVIEKIAQSFQHNLKPPKLQNQAYQPFYQKPSQGPNLQERIAHCNTVLESCNDLNPNETNKIMIENMPVLSESKTTSYRPYLGKKKPFQLPDRIKLRQMFKEKMKQTVDRIIVSTENVSESPSTESICQAFQLPAPTTNHWPILSFCRRIEETLELLPIDCEEIVEKLKSLKNCAPGPDRVNYSHLKQFDPEGKFMCSLFNKIIDQGISPDSWRCFQTTLIPKPGKESYSDISSWRPIALANSSYKLFTSILADRLYQWVDEHEILHPGQKGGSEFEGCIEHNAVLNAIFEQAHSRPDKSKSAVIAWLDIRNAFPSVPHQYLWNNLRAYGVGEQFVHTLEELYVRNSTYYKCGHTITQEINVNVGVKQGCPISMILFALAINPVLSAIEASNIEKYDILGHKVQILAYADDIAIVANNHSDLQQLLDIASTSARQCNLIFQPKKCAYLTIPHDEVDSSSISIEDTFIRKLVPGQFYEYLGVPVGDKIDQNPYTLIEELIQSADKINKSELMKHQKIKAVKTFLFPKLTFSFRTREIKRSALESDSSTKPGQCKPNPSAKLRKILRSMLCLPPQSENCYLYVSTNNGGVGLWDLYDEYNLQQLVQAFKLMNSKDKNISDLIRKSLIFAAGPRYHFGNPTMNQALDWINGRFEAIPNTSSKKTWWLRVQKAISVFKSLHNTVINFEYVDGNITMRITDARQITTIAKIRDTKKITMILHQTVHYSYLMKWSMSNNSHLLCLTLGHNPKLNKLILSGRIGTFAWDFIHRAKTNCLQVNAKPMTLDPAKRKCRRCHTEEETMIHALQVCRSNLSIITLRHDACLDIIYQAIKCSNLIININETISYLSSSDDVCRQRIDIYVEDVTAKRIYLIDLKCPMDYPDTMARAAHNNLIHYENLKVKVSQSKPSYIVELDTIIVGALGSIPDSSSKILRNIGVSEHCLPFVVNDLSVTSIRHTARIWHLHCSGVLIDFVGPQKELAAEACQF